MRLAPPVPARGLAAFPLALVLALSSLRAAEVVPVDLPARRAELAGLSESVKGLQTKVGPKALAVIPRLPEFVRHMQDLHRVPLDPGERQALLAGGASALPEAKRAVFEAAAPNFAGMKKALAEYFAAYDAYQRDEIHLRTYGAILGALERREALLPLVTKEKHRQEFSRAFARLETEERTYRERLADPADPFHTRSEEAKELWFLAADLDELLLRYERKFGLAPKLPFGHRVGNFFRGLKDKARAVKINALSLPAMTRLFVHLFLRPFWAKDHAPDQTNDLVRFFSKSYRWAAGLKLRVHGQEGIPTDAPIVFALSHRATIEDAMTMAAVVPGTYSFMWAVRAMPKWLQKKLVADPTVIAVGGKHPDGTKVDAVAEAIEAIRQGRNLALFPEGNVPTPQGETRPLRVGIDVITAEVSEEPVYIVPITIVDTAIGWEATEDEPSKDRPMAVDVFVGAPIDPLRLKSVPGADQQFLLDVIRGIYHRNLYRRDLSLDPPACETLCRSEDLGVIPHPAQETFESLHSR